MELKKIKLRGRITPARAGRTHRPLRRSNPSWDHPRSRGKDLPPSNCLLLRSGSPPLAREGPLTSFTAPLLSRITPARAGRTSLTSSEASSFQDHPRSRGKDIKRSRILQCFILTDPVISLLSPKVSNKFPHRPMLCAALFRQFHTLL